MTLPAGALVDDVAITMTPLVNVAGLPPGAPFVAGVQFGPDGLQLFKPAVLTITLPPGIDATQLAGLQFHGAGVDVSRALMTVSGQTVKVTVTHFSGFLAATDPGGVLQPFFDAPRTATETFYTSRALTNDVAFLIGNLREWYYTVVDGRLVGAGASDARLAEALGSYVSWRFYVEAIGIALGLDQDRILRELAPELRQAANLARPALLAGVQRANARCVINHSLPAANAALRFQAIADALELVTPGGALDLETVLESLCVEVVYEDTQFPALPQPGQTASLQVQAGFAFEDDGVVRHQPLSVLIEGRHGIALSDIFRVGTTTAQGAYVDGFGIDANATQEGVQLDITTCLAAPASGSHLRKVCQQAFILRGLEVEPGTATVAPSATQQFGARMLGTPTTAVTWTTTAPGATVSAAGLFTAGTTPGSFAVTATSTANPSLSSRATVTIGGGVVRFVSIDTEVATNTLLGVIGDGLGNNVEIRRPIGDAAGLVSAVQAALVGVDRLSGVSIRLDLPATLAVNLSGFSVDTGASVTAGCGPGAVAGGTLNVSIGRTGVVETFQPITVRACGTTINLQAGAMGASAPLSIRVTQGGTVNANVASGQQIDVSFSDAGTVRMSPAGFRVVRLRSSTNVQASLTGPMDQGSLFELLDNVGLAFEPINVAGRLGSLNVANNRSSSFRVNAASVAPTDTNQFAVRIAGNVSVPLSAFNIGSITATPEGGALEITNNQGFSNAQALAFANARTVNGTVLISGNQP